MTFGAEMDVHGKKNFSAMVNDALLGGNDYPVLTGVADILTGMVSGGAGLAWTILSTAIATQRTIQRVLVREGDELWLTEFVGKVKNGSSYEVHHAAYYWIVDPYRKIDKKVGYAVVVHEDRDELVIKYV
jgi:hypothetical protein